MNINYVPDIPLGSDNPSASQPNLLINCNAVASIVSVDLVGFNDPGNNSGYHQKSTYVDQTSSPPGAVTGADVVYSATVNTLLELFLQRPSGTAIQLTSGTTKAGAPFPSAGQTFLPGGFQLKWGSGSLTGPGSNTVTFTAVGLTAFPTNGAMGFVCPYATGNQFNVTNVTQTSISVATPGGGASSFLWLAIGY
jgi:hypothetical protein